jgi:hypothetical protein
MTRETLLAGEGREVPLAPCVIPFGENIVMTASGMKDGKAIVVVRAVGDEFVGHSDPAAAWAANEANGGPAWFLAFSTAASCRSMAEMCLELAHALETPTPSPAREK